MARIDIDKSTKLVYLEAYKEKLACGSSHRQLPSVAHTRIWSPKYIYNLMCYLKPMIYEREI